ncbi:glycosyltransferase [Mucilaginibacter aquaedulcis]|uniref:glycosyltransferase n=1 Tax=Mucilaginibacter aquaedulcis TaxID=1187081 RepID=UPI0025B5FB1A|nr:glycosyltransferase [Mucilaginibacter aquaedulcis]MDN3550202.1 glycosyltransferase [Mucilaginibacter aquaedulcis]
MDLTINQTFTSNFPKLPKQLIIFSHLRWDFVYQRPQHLASRLSQLSKLYYIEEPIFDAHEEIYFESVVKNKVGVMVPHLKPGLSHGFTIEGLTRLFREFIKEFDMIETAFWYYTPMALEFSANYEPQMVIYDCMDELSAFKFAPENLQILEKELLEKADLVLTGGRSLYEAKKEAHNNIHAYPSSIDKEHFLKAREIFESPSDQVNGIMPKLGFYGVIDERFDINLISGIAEAKPDWQIILIGPVVKIDPNTLPNHSNIHYLGPKTYEQLPDYMAGWDIALIPFFLNESTRFISPTKTPEYLAAGLPVISTPIRDVVNPYGINNLVSIGSNADDFIKLAEDILADERADVDRLSDVDVFLALNSWDETFEGIKNEMLKVIERKSQLLATERYV